VRIGEVRALIALFPSCDEENAVCTALRDEHACSAALATPRDRYPLKDFSLNTRLLDSEYSILCYRR
jgi:hypothetical protein